MKKNSKSKIKSNSPLPLYFQIKEDLKSKIENGILNEGEYLPSEFKLMERYGVSRPTIRQADENLPGILQYAAALSDCKYRWDPVSGWRTCGFYSDSESDGYWK